MSYGAILENWQPTVMSVYATNSIHTFMLPYCIVTDFFLNNQPDALIILILFCYKTPDDGQSGCPKHVKFYNRINLDN